MVVVVGIGNLGFALARRLVIRSQQVVVVEIDAARRDAWKAMTGLDAVASLGDLDWDGVERVFVVVRLTSEAEQVLDELAGAAAGHALSCFVVTTLEPAFAAGLGRHDDGAMRVVELPVSGGALGALGGTLTMMAAGPSTGADRAFLRSMLASHVVEFAERGHPTVAKLLNNVTAAYNARALAEMLLVARREGIDVARFYEVLRTASGGSWVANGFLELVDELLEKDATLLRAHLGSLPDISVGADAGLVERLDEARRALEAAQLTEPR